MLTKNQHNRTTDERPIVEDDETRQWRDAQKNSPIFHQNNPHSKLSNTISTVKNEELYVIMSTTFPKNFSVIGVQITVRSTKT